MENKRLWNQVKRPPETALKEIKGGRLSGMTDISPQWRYEIMTEIFGPCGIGWGYDIKSMWTEDGAHEEKMCFAHVEVWYKETSEDGTVIFGRVPGTGGSKLIAKESKGLYTSDEGYKMALTDAVSVALKMLGVGADIYAGRYDGSKYMDEPKKEPKDERIEKLHALPEELKEGLRLLKYTIAPAIALCDSCGWDNEKIKKEINRRIDTQEAK